MMYFTGEKQRKMLVPRRRGKWQICNGNYCQKRRYGERVIDISVSSYVGFARGLPLDFLTRSAKKFAKSRSPILSSPVDAPGVAPGWVGWPVGGGDKGCSVRFEARLASLSFIERSVEFFYHKEVFLR